MRITNSVFVVAGGASGLGASTARMLAAIGIRVMTIAPGIFETPAPCG